MENNNGGCGISVGYRGGVFRNVTAVNPIANASDTNGMKYLVAASLSSNGQLVLEDCYIMDEGSGSGSKLLKIAGRRDRLSKPQWDTGQQRQADGRRWHRAGREDSAVRLAIRPGQGGVPFCLINGSTLPLNISASLAASGFRVRNTRTQIKGRVRESIYAAVAGIGCPARRPTPTPGPSTISHGDAGPP